MSTDLGDFGTGLGGYGNTVKITRYAAGSANGGGVAFQLTGTDGMLRIRLEALAMLFRACCQAEGKAPASVLKEARGEVPSDGS